MKLNFTNAVAMLGSLALLASAPLPSANADLVLLPDITVTSLGHLNSNDPFFGGTTIFDGAGGYVGGSISAPTFTGQIHNGDTVTERIVAPAGEQFVVHYIPGLNMSLNVNFQWLAGGDGTSGSPSQTISFENLTGTAPSTSYTFFGVGNAGNAILGQYQGTVTGDVSFTSFDVSFPVSSSPPGNTVTYSLRTDSPVFDVFGGTQMSGFDATLLSIESVQAVPEAPAWLAMAAVALCFGAAAVICRRHAQPTAGVKNL